MVFPLDLPCAGDLVTQVTPSGGQYVVAQMASANEVAQLKSAIDANDLEGVAALMTRDALLMRQPSCFLM